MEPRADLGGTTGPVPDPVLALAKDLGHRGFLACVTRIAEPPEWHELTRAARQPG